MQAVALSVAVLLAADSSIAHADRVIPFLSGGLSIGAALHGERDSGFLIGGELSGGALLTTTTTHPGAETTNTPPWWFGAYADVLHDFGPDTTRISFGPEIGYRFIGLDGGAVHELGDDPAWGFAIRPSFTVGPLSAYVRYTRFGAEAPESSHVEIGLLAKFPYAHGFKLF